jgi:hypothetical protein
MCPVDSAPQEDYLHLKPRYSFRETCATFGVHEKTLRAWMKRGVPLPNGRHARLTYFRLGMRNTVFLQEDIDRIQGLRTRAVADGAELVEFPGPAERADLRVAVPQRATHALREARILAWRGSRED